MIKKYTEFKESAKEPEKEPAKGSINEETTVNYDKWRRSMNGKSMGRYTFFLQDPMGNKKRYVVNIMYVESPKHDEIYLKEILMGKWDGSSMPHALSNMQNKPAKQFDFHERTMWDNEVAFNKIIDAFAGGDKKAAEKAFNEISMEWFETDFITMIKEWLKTGVETFVKVEFNL